MSSILITGGTGSFGKKFVNSLLKKNSEFDRIIVFSRDELKQFEMQQSFTSEELSKLRFFIGDVRDKDRLYRAMEGVNTVVHAAALKQVPAAEYNPTECIRTNINGAENVIDAAIARDVKNVVALSTDKAAAPVNLYGATKLAADKLFVSARNIVGGRDIKFSVVRYGNVMGSRGSVIPFFQKEKKNGVLPITDEAMTRFNISLQEGVDLVWWAIQNHIGGEIFVPKIPSYRVVDVADAICEDCEKKVVGIRPGEKLHEELITKSDSLSTMDIGDYYVILPQTDNEQIYAEYRKRGAVAVERGFSYDSSQNPDFLTVEQLRKLIEDLV